MFEKYIASGNLVRFPGGKEEVYVSVAGKILDSFGNELSVTRDQNGDERIFASLWLGPGYYLITDVLALTFKNVKLPMQLWDQVAGFYIDGNCGNRHPSNVGYRFRQSPLENLKFPGYYYIPMYTEYCISETGVIIHGLVGKPNNVWYKSKSPNRKNIKGGYFYKNLKFDGSGKWMNAPRHRLLGYVFKPYPNEVDSLDVNHIDGIPGNDRLDNLEWATRSQNNYHAIALGMKTAFRVTVKNVLTGELIEYASISQCAERLGYPTDETIRFRLYKQPFGKVFSDGFQFKLSSDTRDFPKVEDPAAAIIAAKRNKPILVNDLLSGKITKYPTALAAATAIGIKAATLKYRLAEDTLCRTEKYILKYECDERTWEEIK